MKIFKSLDTELYHIRYLHWGMSKISFITFALILYWKIFLILEEILQLILQLLLHRCKRHRDPEMNFEGAIIILENQQSKYCQYCN